MSKKNFKDIKSLDTVKLVIHEAEEALNDSKRTVFDTLIPDVIISATGAGIGGGISFLGLFALGMSGFSAAGITSGLAAIAKFVGLRGMLAGLGVFVAPVAIGSILASLGWTMFKKSKLKKEKVYLVQLAMQKQDAIIRALKQEVNVQKDRADLLNGLNVLLQQAIRDLKADLGVA